MEARGEEKENPFLEFGALVDLQNGVNGYAKTAHGGFYGVVLDEVMGTAANAQASMSILLFFRLLSPSDFRMRLIGMQSREHSQLR